MQSTEKSANASPNKLPEPSEPENTILMPTITTVIASQVERSVVSHKNSQLKTAASAGVALIIRNVLAIEVILTLSFF